MPVVVVRCVPARLPRSKELETCSPVELASQLKIHPLLVDYDNSVAVPAGGELERLLEAVDRLVAVGVETEGEERRDIRRRGDNELVVLVPEEHQHQDLSRSCEGRLEGGWRAE